MHILRSNFGEEKVKIVWEERGIFDAPESTEGDFSTVDGGSCVPLCLESIELGLTPSANSDAKNCGTKIWVDGRFVLPRNVKIEALLGLRNDTALS